MKKDVVIAGAGPVGMCMALGLALKGFSVALVEKREKFELIPKASTIHPPTLEIMEEWGVVDKLLEKGLKSETYQYWDRKTRDLIAEFDLSLLKDDTKYPFRLQLEQSDLQMLLEDHFKNMNEIDILFGHEVIEYKQSDNEVLIKAIAKGGEEKRLTSKFLIGADGASSTIRKRMGIEYEGFTYPQKFLILGITSFDFTKAFPGLGHVSYFFDPNEFVALIHNHQMWKYTIPWNVPESTKNIAEIFQEKLKTFTQTEEPFNIVHNSIYNVHQRVASQVFDNRVILIGDAAHVNNPLGGMGMNSGIHDAYFLTEDIVHLIKNNGDGLKEVLGRFEHNRKIAIEKVQKRTIENKKNATELEQSEKVQEKMARIASNAKLAHEYLMQSSMISEFKELNKSK